MSLILLLKFYTLQPLPYGGAVILSPQSLHHNSHLPNVSPHLQSCPFWCILHVAVGVITVKREHTLPSPLQWFLSLLFLNDFIYLSLETGEGREKEERNIDVREKHQLVVCYTPPTGNLGCNPGICPEGNWTSNLPVSRVSPNSLSHTSQGESYHF